MRRWAAAALLGLATGARAQSANVTWSDADLAQARELARREANFYRRIGVDGFVCWFGKLAPYSAAVFYTLSPEDMARFGITGVTVRDPQAPSRPDVQRLAIDPAMVTFIRPDDPPAR